MPLRPSPASLGWTVLALLGVLLAFPACDLHQTGAPECQGPGTPPAASAVAGLAAGTSVVISPERRDEFPAAVMMLQHIPERGLYLGDAGAVHTPPYVILGLVEPQDPPAGQVHSLGVGYWIGGAMVSGWANVRVTRSDAEAFEGTFAACLRNCSSKFWTRCGTGFPVSGAFRGVRKDVGP